MANQITIDIGAAANDGTGDPLRTAFNYVNNNFSNVWNTGLPNSNVQFSDNRILTVNTNANLVLAPNGIGKVASNVDIVPNTANAFALGSPTRRWNTVYTQYLDVTNYISGTLGNITVSVANLHITGGSNGYVLQTDGAGNLSWTAQTGGGGNGNPGGANTQVQYNNAGSFGGSASFTFDRTSNVLTVNGNISAGNVFTSNTITSHDAYIVTGSFSGDAVTGNSSLYIGSPNFVPLGTDVMAQFTGNVTNYGQINFQNYSNSPTASGDYIATADNGTDSTHYIDMGITSSTWDDTQTNVLPGLAPNNGYLYTQDGNLTLGTRNGNTSNKWNFDTTGNLTVAGNVLPTGNNTQSLGSATKQWKDLWVSNNTIYINSVPISLAAGNILTVNGADVVTTAANGESSIGNLDILGTTISIAAGAPETYINLSSSVEGWAYIQVPTDAAANTYNTRIHNDAGNIEFGTGDYSTGSTNYTWTLDNTGNVNLPANGDINFNGGSIAQTLNEDIYIRASDDENDGWSVYNVVDDGAGNILSQTRLEFDQYTIRTDAQGASYTWAFRDTGVLELPGDIYGNVGDNLIIKIGDSAGSDTFIDLQTRSHVADALISNIRIANPNVTISTANAAYNWTFDGTGNLTVPGNSIVSTANATGGAGGNSITIQAGAADQSNFFDTPGGNVNITGGLGAFNDGGGGGPGGDVNITGGLSADPAGHAGNVNIGSGTSGWTFDYTGNITLPQGGVVYETNIPFGGLEGNTIALKPSGGTNADQQLLVYPTAGVDFNHLHLTSGNLWNTELFLGNDDFYVKLANTGNIVINANDNISNTAQWSFNYDGTISTNNDLILQVSDGIPTSLSNWEGGGGWNELLYTGLATTGGTGTGLTVDVAAGGAGYISINEITINTPGTGYTNGDVITINNENDIPGTFTIGVLAPSWTFGTDSSLTLPTISLGTDLDEQTVVQSQRKLIPSLRWSAVIDGTTPTIVYTATDSNTTSMKVTMQIQHSGTGIEFFEVFATESANNTYYTVSNRVAPPALDASTVVVGLNGSNEMQITVTINSGAATSWVTYDAVEFGIPQD